jgi:hypothetical protein
MEGRIVRPQRRENGIGSDVASDIDEALSAASPSDDKGARLSNANGSDVRRVGLHGSPPSIEADPFGPQQVHMQHRPFHSRPQPFERFQNGPSGSLFQRLP